MFPVNFGLGDFFASLAGSATVLTSVQATIVAAVMVVLVVLAPTWKVFRSVVTIAHEGGHAGAALLTGRKLQSIKLHSDTSGLTVSRGKPSGLGMIVTASAGYTAPAVLGVVGAWLVSHGFATQWTWAFIALLVIMLFKIRNLFGAWSLVATGVVLGVGTVFGSADVRAYIAHALVWLFLFGACKAVWELHISRRKQRRSRGRGTTDADVLGTLSWLPASVWVFGFGLIGILCVLAGVYLLLPSSAPLREALSTFIG